MKAHTPDGFFDEADGSRQSLDRGLRELCVQFNELQSHVASLAQQFVSPNETDSNGEPANVVDGLFSISRALHDIARSIHESSRKE